jgi:hypothetical protein
MGNLLDAEMTHRKFIGPRNPKKIASFNETGSLLLL